MATFTNPATVNTCPPYFGFTPVIPKFYDNVESEEERILKLSKLYTALVQYVNELGTANNDNATAIAELQDLFTQFMESGFNDYYAAQIEKWIEDNLPWLWETFAQNVFFGLTDDGYFCAYIPESWDGITFDTGAVYGAPPYGRLIVRYLAEGEGVIDNTSDYYPYPDYQQQINNLQAQIDAIEEAGGSGYILPEATPYVLGGMYTATDTDFKAYIGY